MVCWKQSVNVKHVHQSVMQDAQPRRKRVKLAKYNSVDEAVLIWFKQVITIKLSANELLMKLKSIASVCEMEIADWEADLLSMLTQTFMFRGQYQRQ